MRLQHHDSALVAVELNRSLRKLDAEEPCPFTGRAALDWLGPEGVRGQNSKECWSSNVARFLAGCFKKNSSWGSYMLSKYGDDGGIPVVKSARFWSVMIVASDYLYTRFDYVFKFHQERREMYKDKQIGKTLEYAALNKDLLEFDWLLNAVDYHGFHSAFNKSAQEKAAQEQAAYVRRVVEEHKAMATDDTKMLAHWRKHARTAMVNRALFKEKAEYFKTTKGAGPRGRVQPPEDVARRRAELTRTLAVPNPAPNLLPRIRAMHQAVVTKLGEHLRDISTEGDVDKAVAKSRAPNENFLAEDSFQQSRCAVFPLQQQQRVALSSACAAQVPPRPQRWRADRRDRLHPAHPQSADAVLPLSPTAVVHGRGSAAPDSAGDRHGQECLARPVGACTEAGGGDGACGGPAEAKAAKKGGERGGARREGEADPWRVRRR